MLHTFRVVTVTTRLKSVYIYQNYRKNKSIRFFWNILCARRSCRLCKRSTKFQRSSIICCRGN